MEVRKILVVDRGQSKEEMFLHFYIVDPIVCRGIGRLLGNIGVCVITRSIAWGCICRVGGGASGMVGLPPHPKIKKHNKEHKKEEVLYLKICMRVDKNSI